jgi:hypothetical protein
MSHLASAREEGAWHVRHNLSEYVGGHAAADFLEEWQTGLITNSVVRLEAALPSIVQG